MSKDYVRVGSRDQRGRGKTLREICSECKEYYLVNLYDKVQSWSTGSYKAEWKQVGKYCRNCRFVKLK